MAPIWIAILAVGGVVALALAAILVMAILVPMFKILGEIVRRTTRFVAGEIIDALRVTGACVTAVVLVPLAAFAVALGRWSAASHYGRAIQSEIKSIGAGLYRIAIGHPINALSLTPLSEGLEKRLPQVVKASPGRDKPAKRVGQFEGYTIVGSLAGGGSGGKLYIAQPDAIRQAAFRRQGFGEVGQVVIKAFSLRDGSSLPQIVRESRSLDAAKKLGLVLDHELNDERFYYVMKFVPGESLSLVTQRLHASSGPDGLDEAHLRSAVSYISDLLSTLDAYHRGGLWHKDVKPDNIIVDREKAHLVDFGLVTPLRSAMTLTTHGTEYFRDPEMVRMALKGVKVQEVDGARFDIYAAGAVLYSVIENSFPAHGGLSQITRKCPEALRWIVRRAMTDYDKRYPTAAMMLGDLRMLAQAPDPFALKPVDLPSVGGGPLPVEPLPSHEIEMPALQMAHAAVGAGSTGAAPGHERARRLRSKPRLALRNWWTGAYGVEGHDDVEVAEPGSSKSYRVGPVVIGITAGSGVTINKAGSPAAVRHEGGRRSASEQVAAARGRAAAARERARSRREDRLARSGRTYRPGVNAGVMVAVVMVIGVVVGFVLLPGTPRKVLTASVGSPLGEATPGDVAPTPPGAPEQVVGNESGIGMIEPGMGPGNITVLAAAGSSQLSKLASGRTFVIVSDVEAFDAKGSQLVAFTVKCLRDAGYTVAGDPTSATAPEPEITEMLAQLRMARGLRPLGSEEARQAVAGWLKQSKGAQYVLWIERGETRPVFHVFVPEAVMGRDFEAFLVQNTANQYALATIQYAEQRAAEMAGAQ